MEKEKVNRTALTDGTGRWFDLNKTVVFNEASEWDGNNWISLATGSQWQHEKLYKTAGNRFILGTWSNYQGVMDTYTEITKEEAARWLSINNHEPDELCKDEFFALEIE
ncbi:MAG: hypothetical protein WC337_02840 [Candidatus Muiribacteriota bacterium]